MANEPTSEEMQGINAVLKKVDAKQKKNKKLLGVIIVIVLIAIVAFFLISSQPPEPLPPPVDLCLNGIQDAGEEGIDCGAPCPNPCEEPPPAYVDSAFVLPTSVSDIALDTASNRIYIVDEMRHRLMAYDNEFNHIANFGEELGQLPDGSFGYSSGGYGNNQLLFPATISFANGEIYVLDRVPRVQVFNKELAYKKTLTFSAEALEKFSGIEDPPNAEAASASITVSDSGKIYISDQLSNSFGAFDNQLNLLNVIEGGEFEYSPNIPRQIAIGPNGNVFIADEGNSRIQVFDSELNFLNTITDRLLLPVGIAVSNTGKMFVLDTADSKLKVFDSQGNFIEEIGGLGTSNNEFYKPVVVKLDSEGNVYVVEKGNARVQVFDKNLKFVRSINGLNRTFNVSFAPFYSSISPNGDIAISDSINNKVIILDPDFVLKKVIGGRGFGNNEFNSPKGIAFSQDGRLFVVDSGNRRFQVFSEDFEYTESITNDTLIWPYAISISDAGNLFVIDQKLSKVLMLNQQGNIVGELGKEEGLLNPSNLVATGGKVYVGDGKAKIIKVFTSPGLNKLETIAGVEEDLGKEVYFGQSMAMDEKGRLLFTDYLNKQVISYDFSTSMFSPFFEFERPPEGESVLEVASRNSLISVTDMGNHRVKFFDSSGAELKEMTVNDLT